MSSDASKSGMLNFILEKMVISWITVLFPLYISGASNDETETVLIENSTVVVPSLASTYEEADMPIMQHVVYCVRFLNTEGIIIHANDTNVIISCIYFCEKNPECEM